MSLVKQRAIHDLFLKASCSHSCFNHCLSSSMRVQRKVISNKRVRQQAAVKRKTWGSLVFELWNAIDNKRKHRMSTSLF